MHSAVWDPSYDYTGKKIAIIGIGSTATQIVPNIQPIAGHLKCFVRSAAWITAGGFAEKHAGPGGTNFQYTEEQKQFFRDHPDEHRQYCKEIEDEINERYAAVSTITGPALTDRSRKTDRCRRWLWTGSRRP